MDKIEARMFDDLKEVRLYKENGDYWPIKYSAIGIVDSFVKFINESTFGHKRDYSQQSLNQNPLYSDPYR